MTIWRLNMAGPQSEVVNAYINSATENVIDGTEVGVWCNSVWAAIPGALQTETIASQCIPCGEGKYKSTFDKGACIECAEGKYYNKVEPSHCLECPANGHSPRGSIYENDCMCDKGFSGPYSMCAKCENGKYKARIGDFSCEVCPDNSMTTGIARARSDCACESGFRLSWVIEHGPVYNFQPHVSKDLFLSYAASIGAVVVNLNSQHGTAPDGGIFGAGTG